MSLSSPQRPVELVSPSIVCQLAPLAAMSAKAAINKEVFVPHDEKMLAAVTVKRRTKKKIPFLATGGQGDYMTFICLSGKKCPSLSPLVLVLSIISLVTLATFQVGHFNTSPFILPLMLSLMSALTFPLPTGRLIANLIYCRALGQSFLSRFSLKGLDCLGINWGLNYFVYPSI